MEQNTRVVNNNDKLDLIIYYKNPKTAQLIMTNNTNKKTQLNTTNVIYQFTCPNEDCMLRSTNYIGSTTTTLSRRLTMHLTNGAILLQGNCIGEPMRYAVSGNMVCKHLSQCSTVLFPWSSFTVSNVIVLLAHGGQRWKKCE